MNNLFLVLSLIFGIAIGILIFWIWKKFYGNKLEKNLTTVANSKTNDEKRKKAIEKAEKILKENERVLNEAKNFLNSSSTDNK